MRRYLTCSHDLRLRQGSACRHLHAYQQLLSIAVCASFIPQALQHVDSEVLQDRRGADDDSKKGRNKIVASKAAAAAQAATTKSDEEYKMVRIDASSVLCASSDLSPALPAMLFKAPCSC